MCVRTLFACVSESFYRFVGPGRLNLFHTSAISGLRLRELKPRRFVCPSVHYKGMLRMAEKKDRSHNVQVPLHNRLCCIVLTRQMAARLHATFRTLRGRDGNVLQQEATERERAKTGLPESVWTVNPACKGAATHLCD